MKERPILFNGEMVRAVLGGRKTQTRRVIKLKTLIAMHVAARKFNQSPRTAPDALNLCPYGKVGDQLWVRETFCWQSGFDPSYGSHDFPFYRADCVGEYADMVESLKPWKPSIFMPRCASRITLEITDVRVERVQDISEEDACREGVHQNMVPTGITCPHTGTEEYVPEPPSEAFQDLWDSINAKRGYGWDSNPWVWVVEFKRIDKEDA